MLSLPYLQPREDLWSTSPFRPNQSTTTTNDATRQHHHHQQAAAAAGGSAPQRTTSSLLHHRHHASQLSPAAQLLADEYAIESRKLNVRRFGAGWLRPPGVAKTFQARLDEETERREQVEVARREAVMAELAAAAAAASGEGIDGGGQMGGAGGGEEVEMGEERDLDDEVPDADEGGSEEDGDEEDEDEDEETDEEEEEEEEGEEAEGNVTMEPSRFGEESLLEGSLVGGDGYSSLRTEQYLDAEDAELDGRAQDRRDLGIERDLDEEIPEAGSYEHTDTEEEESSDEDDDASELYPIDEHGDVDSSHVHAPGRKKSRVSAASRRSVASASVANDLSILDADVSEMLDSSFVGYPLPFTTTTITDRAAPPHVSVQMASNNNAVRRMRRSLGNRGRWSGASAISQEDVRVSGLGTEEMSSPNVSRSSANSVMARLRAARRN